MSVALYPLFAANDLTVFAAAALAACLAAIAARTGGHPGAVKLMRIGVGFALFTGAIAI